MLAEIFKNVLLMSAVGGILSIILLCLKPVTRRLFSPRWQYYIWMTVLIVLIIPVRFSLPQRSLDNMAAEPSQTTVINDDATDTEITISSNHATVAQPQPLSELQQIPQLPEISLPQNMIWYMSILWLMGAITILLIKILKYLMFLRAIKKNSYRDDTVSNVPKRLCVRRTDLLDAPLIVGLIKPVLYLPDVELSQHDLKYIYLHELTHYRRHDLLYKWLTMLVLSLHWFNPLVYAVSRQVDLDCETSCDAAATRELSVQEQNDYMNMILDMLLNSKSRLRPLTTQMANGKKTLKRRFETMRNRRKTSRLVSALSVLLATALLSTTVFASGVLSGLAADTYTIEVENNGEKIKLVNKPFIENNTVYLPLRELLNTDGIDDISYNNGYIEFLVDSDTPIEYRGQAYDFWVNRIQIGNAYAYIAGHSGGTTENAELLNAPILKQDVTYVPYDLFDELKVSGQGVFEDMTVTVNNNDTTLAGTLYRNDDLNFNVALPLSWAGKYQILEDENAVSFVQTATYDKYGAGSGTLCRVEVVSPEYAAELLNMFGGSELLYSGENGAYIYEIPTDVQYPIWADRDEEDVSIAAEYQEMFAQVDFIKNSFALLARTSAYYSSVDNLSFDN